MATAIRVSREHTQAASATNSMRPVAQAVFIDARVSDLATLVHGAADDAVVHVLAPERDGVAQIADILAAEGLRDLAAVSIVAHGVPGAIAIGSTRLDGAALRDRAQALAQIGASLGPHGSVLVYACDVGRGDAGARFVAALSHAVGAPVAAASRPVGAAALGGNWDLDIGNAAIAAGHPFTSDARATFSGLLPGGKSPESTSTGGTDSATGPGGNGFNGGGGGAGVTGGAGGAGASHSSGGGGGGGGGTAAVNGVGGDGTNGGNGGGSSTAAQGGTAGGGGGGAHGFYGVVLPVLSSQGGKGGNGGSSAQSYAGGGGAGGFGAVVTGDGDLGTLNVALTGGAGGGTGFSFAGFGGSGGTGLLFTTPDEVTLTIAAAVTGGVGGRQGGNGGIGLLFTDAAAAAVTIDAAVQGGAGAEGFHGAHHGLPNRAGAGGDGIVGQDLTLTIGVHGSVTGGMGGEGSNGSRPPTPGTRANAITFTGGTNTLTLQGGASVTGTVVADDAAGSDDTLVLGGGGTGSFDVGAIGASGQYRGFEAFRMDGGTWSLSGTTTADWTVNGGTLGGSATLGDLTLNGGTLSPGNSPVVMASGSIAASAPFTFIFELGGTDAGVPEFDQLQVTGTVSLGGAALTVSFIDDFTAGYAPGLHDIFRIIDNDGTDAVTGTFNGLPEGAVFTVDGVELRITYRGGTGNDVVVVENSPLVVTTLADELEASDTNIATADFTNLSLREALVLANSLDGADTITFDEDLAGGALHLTLGALQTNSAVTIDGDLDNDRVADITISAASTIGGTNATSRVLFVRSETTLEGLVMRDGRNAHGAGIYVNPQFINGAGGSGLTLIDCTVTANEASGFLLGEGGGIDARNSAVTLIRSTISDNRALSGGDGAGIHLGPNAPLTLLDSTVSGNYAGGGGNPGGGGISTFFSSVTLVNSTVVGNFSLGFGGGIYNSNGAPLALINSTVTGNLARGTGGGITTRGDTVTTLVNSVVAGNESHFGVADLFGFDDGQAPDLVFVGGNIIGSDPIGFTVSGTTPVQIAGDSQAALETVFADVALVDPDGDGPGSVGPFFAGALADNGGTVQTVALGLGQGNPALNSGDATQLVEATIGLDLNGDGDIDNTVTTDARGLPRTIGAGPDLGAFEIQNSDPSQAVNLGADVDEGESVVIAQAALDYDDPEQGDGDITYTITAALANGELFLDGNPDPLGVGDTFTQADIANGDLSYTHDGGETTADSFAFDVSDGQGGTASGTFALTVNPLNDTAGGAAGGTIQYVEDQGPTALDPSLTVTDPDDTHLEGARVAITGNFAAGEDVLAFTPQGGITGNYNAATGVLTLNGTALLADYETVLRSVTYSNSGQNPSNLQRTVNFQVDDGDTLAGMGTVGVNVIPQLDPPGDINGDHTTDIVWRENTGRVALWEMDGVNVLANTFIADIPNYWHIVDANGDFDGDGNSDILWQDDVGVLVLWTMDGPNIVSNTAVAGPLPDYWHIEDTGDFTGDGRADILWRDDAGRVVLWEMDGATVVSNTLVADVATTSRIEDSGDFTGDGMNDILWRDQDGTLRIWEMDGATVVSDTTVGTVADTRHLAGSGDFNGDGRFDLLWRDDDGTVTLWEMDGAAIIGDTAIGTIPNHWRIADIGDYTGDGDSDILWRENTGTVVLWEMDGPVVVDSTAASTIPTHWQIQA